jgi:hypothetical protein
MTEPRHRATWWPRTIASGVLLLALAASTLAYLVVIHARDAADRSCLASLHAAVDRQGRLDPSREAPTWRSWSQGELREAIERLSGYGDCETSPDARWKRLLRVRSRKTGSAVEVQLWLTGKPGVSSPSGLQGLE